MRSGSTTWHCSSLSWLYIGHLVLESYSTDDSQLKRVRATPTLRGVHMQVYCTLEGWGLLMSWNTRTYTGLVQVALRDVRGLRYIVHACMCEVIKAHDWFQEESEKRMGHLNINVRAKTVNMWRANFKAKATVGRLVEEGIEVSRTAIYNLLSSRERSPLEICREGHVRDN